MTPLEIVESPRPSDTALMTRAIQIAERLVDLYVAADVTYIYEQLSHVRRYAEDSSPPTQEPDR